MLKAPATPIYNALIRSHHVRSRKKIKTLEVAAIEHEYAVLLKSDGKPPGIMYVEAHSESHLRHWVEAVRGLHYLNYDLVSPPAISMERSALAVSTISKVSEVKSVKEFARRMQEIGVYTWWRKAMGYAHP